MEESINTIENTNTVNVSYTRPKFWHRCMANFVDIFIFLILTIALFAATRAVVQATPSYQDMSARHEQLQLQSGLYVEHPTTKENIDIVYYCDNIMADVYGREYDGKNMDGTDRAPSGKNGTLVVAINKFIAFCEVNCAEERYNDLLDYYDQARLEPTYEGQHYFYEAEDGTVVIDPVLSESVPVAKYYYTVIFKPFIEKKCIPFLNANVTEYRTINRSEFNLLVFVEFPIAFFLAAVFTYFIPPLFFRHGRMTLGKALYHIGLIDNKRLLSCTLPRYLARFAIFFFGELLLSFVSFGIPYIISFSLMAFSKNRQGFPDYMLGLYEVDTSKANIYLDYVEAQVKNELHRKAVDFKMKKPL